MDGNNYHPDDGMQKIALVAVLLPPRLFVPYTLNRRRMPLPRYLDDTVDNVQWNGDLAILQDRTHVVQTVQYFDDDDDDTADGIQWNVDLGMLLNSSYVV